MQPPESDAVEWLTSLALRDVAGVDEPAWIDALDASAEDVNEALVTLLAGEDTTTIGRVTLGLAPWWRTTGRITEGCGWLLRSAPRCEANGALQAMAAHLLISAGRISDALDYAGAAGDYGHALVARGHIGVIRADYGPAEALLTRAAGGSSQEVVFEATVLLGQAAMRQQHFEELANLALTVQRLAWESGSERQLAQALLLSHHSHRLQGRREQATAAAREALDVATAARATTLMAVALGDLGGLEIEDGKLAAGRAVLRQSLALTAHGGDVRTTLVTTYNLAEVERLAGDTAAARKLYGAALRAARQLGDERALGFVLTALFDLALAEGEPAAASAPLLEALQVRAAVNDRRGIVLCLEGAVQWAAATGLPVMAVQLLGAADAARFELGVTRDPQQVGPLEQALTAAALPAEQLQAARELGATLDLEAAVQLAVGLLGGPTHRAHQRRPAAQPRLAELQLLGGFSLCIDGLQVDARAWQSRKARDLLKLLGVARGHPVTRESVMESLWPDSDPAALPPRLSVALSTLRSVLGPAREAVIADRDALALDLRLIEVDLVAFHQLATAGRHLRATELYAGEVLPGDVFADWSTLPREAAAAAFTGSAHQAAELLGGDHPDQTVALCRRILAIDPYDERAHQRLVRALRNSGAHGEAKRAEADYVERMTEIGVRVKAL